MVRGLAILAVVAAAGGVAAVAFRAGPPAVVQPLAGVGKPAPPAPRPAAEPGAGVPFLLKAQSKDGAWRSDVYATFKDGTALTGLVLRALQDAADAGDTTDTAAARKKASSWLAKFVKPNGTVAEPKDGFAYPVYTAALAVVTLSHPDNAGHVKARDAWLKYLLARQLTEQNGWGFEDKHYGGWGYYPRVPKKPAAGQAVPAQHLLESNLSATMFALEALAAADHRDPEPYRKAWAAASRFLTRDGGFHFVADDPVRNKAGAVDPAAAPPTFRPYGSATADGARAGRLAEPHLPQPGPAAGSPGPPLSYLGGRWLEKHFAADRHPGDYLPALEPTRDAVYFYYAASVARTFRQLGVKDVGGRHWADALSDALRARQRPDGSWANDRDQQRENDPLLATAYAVSALAECRRAAR